MRRENSKPYANSKPSHAERRPFITERTPSWAEKRPSRAERRPSRAEKKPFRAERRLSRAERRPSQAERKPSRTVCLERIAALHRAAAPQYSEWVEQPCTGGRPAGEGDGSPQVGGSARRDRLPARRLQADTMKQRRESNKKLSITRRDL